MKKLLIIDDDTFSAVHIQGVLGDMFTIQHAASGQEGIDTAPIFEPDIILMDVEMPGMNGYEACKALKAADHTSGIPVIFLSAYSEDEDRLKGYDAGGEDYITKPFNPEELQRKIGVVLRNHLKNAELKSQVTAATQAAISAMASMGDVGIVLGFLRDISGMTDLHEIASAAIQALNNYGLNVCLAVT